MAPAKGTHSPQRVLHVHHNADLYGSSRMLLRWLKGMNRTQFEPLVVVPERGPLTDLIEAEGITVILHPRLSTLSRSALRSWRILPFLIQYPISVIFLWRQIRKHKIAVVYTNTGVILSSALAAWFARVPHVWHIREWFQEFKAIWKPFAWYIRRFSHRIIAISNAVASQFPNRETVVVINDAFSLTDDSPAITKEELREDFRARFQLGDEFVVGCVGRIKFVRKGQEILVEATAKLKQRGFRIKALIVGAPFAGNEAHLERLKNLATELGIEDQVIFTGELADPRPAFAAMDVLAMTSIQLEPFGGVVSEAMSLALPVIATNLGGSLDQVVEGETGFLVPPGDAVALAAAIEGLVNDPELRRRMGIAGAERIRTHFQLPEMCRKIERVLESCIRNVEI